MEDNKPQTTDLQEDFKSSWIEYVKSTTNDPATAWFKLLDDTSREAADIRAKEAKLKTLGINTRVFRRKIKEELMANKTDK